MHLAPTPTGDLICEVLAARARTGETMWTFDSRLHRQAEALSDLGLIGIVHGTVEKTFRAYLTEAGRKEYLDDGYVTPNETKVNQAIAKTIDMERARIAYGLGRCKVIPQEFTLHAMGIVNRWKQTFDT